MSDLMSLLSLGSGGIAAQNTGVSVASNNVANANTEGYSRQRVDLEALGRSPLVGGVRSGSPDRYADALLGNRMRLASGSLAYSKTSSDALSDLEQRLTSGTTLGADLASMFADFGKAAASPTDAITREGAIDGAQHLTINVRRRAAEIADMIEEFNARVQEKAAQITEMMSRLAKTNLAIAKSNDPVLQDQRDTIAKQLTEAVGGTARIDADGQMRFVLDDGAVLVDGTHAASLTTGKDPVTGNTTLAVVDGNAKRDVTKSISGGVLGAQLAVRDGTLTKAQTDLDQFAFDLVASTNAVHSAHAGLDGVTGRNLFTPIGTVAGAAAALEVDPALVADPDQLALGAAGAGPGSNAGALALFQLADGKVATGGTTLGEAALTMVSKVGTAAANASGDVTQNQLVSDHLDGLRDSLAGVDLQEELSNLSRFEHASSAMTKFVSTIDSLLGDLIDRL